MALPVLGLAAAPVIKYLFGTYVVVLSSTFITAYTFLIVSSTKFFHDDKKVKPGLKSGLYKTWDDIITNPEGNIQIYPHSFKPRDDILKKVAAYFDRPRWYREPDKDVWYSLDSVHVRFEIPDKIYNTGRYSCQSSRCHVHTKFEFTKLTLPDEIKGSIKSISKLQNNTSTPVPVAFNFLIPKSDNIGIMFQPIHIQLELVQHYRDSSSSSRVIKFSLPLLSNKTRIGFYKTY